jgi:hypothetical protein
MTEPKVWTFFYGSFINLEVLREVGLVPDAVEVAKLTGFDIRIQPLANLVRADERCVYGITATATHRELSRLYAYAESALGGTYLPEAVLVETLDRRFRPALCYIAPAMEPRTADREYVDRIIEPAKEYGFPDWYLEHLAGFLP